MKISVITISDRASKGLYEDKSGPAIKAILEQVLDSCEITRTIIPDERDALMKAYAEAEDADIIITTGGTGLSPRDITPEVTEEYCDRLIPGIAEYIRSESLKKTRNALFSRGTAGMKGTTVIINFPGSVGAAEFCTRLLAPTLGHAVQMSAGKGH